MYTCVKETCYIHRMSIFFWSHIEYIPQGQLLPEQEYPIKEQEGSCNKNRHESIPWPLVHKIQTNPQNVPSVQA